MLHVYYYQGAYLHDLPRYTNTFFVEAGFRWSFPDMQLQRRSRPCFNISQGVVACESGGCCVICGYHLHMQCRKHFTRQTSHLPGLDGLYIDASNSRATVEAQAPAAAPEAGDQLHAIRWISRQADQTNAPQWPRAGNSKILPRYLSRSSLTAQRALSVN